MTYEEHTAAVRETALRLGEIMADPIGEVYGDPVMSGVLVDAFAVVLSSTIVALTQDELAAETLAAEVAEEVRQLAVKIAAEVAARGGTLQ